MIEKYDAFTVTISHPDMGDVLDILGITKDCCREHMICYRT